MNPRDTLNLNGKDMVPFSQVAMWEDIGTFYQDTGTGAWAGKVPFVASSNTLVAEACYQIIETFCREVGATETRPLLVVELGAGHGCFSHYLLWRLVQRLSGPDPTFQYLMSDLAEANIAFWEEHPALAPYLESGTLDVATYDVRSGSPIKSKNQTRILGSEHRHPGPVVLIANYLFDSLPCEYLRQTPMGMLRGWMPKEADAQMARQENGFLYPSLEFKPLEHREIFDEFDLLGSVPACDDLEGFDFLYPVGAIDVLQQFMELSDEATLFMVNDKGSPRPLGQIPSRRPGFAHHHSLSGDVPFSFLEQWVRARDGMAVVTPSSQPIQNACFLASRENRPFAFTEQAMRDRCAINPTGIALTVHQSFCKRAHLSDLRTLVAHLTLQQWDPIVFDQIGPAVLRQINQETQDAPVIADLIDGMLICAQQYYAHEGSQNTLELIALILGTLGQHGYALGLLQRSATEFGETAETKFRIAECLYSLERYKEALALFEEIAFGDEVSIPTVGYMQQCRLMLSTT